jgi:hypothetical protein
VIGLLFRPSWKTASRYLSESRPPNIAYLRFWSLSGATPEEVDSVRGTLSRGIMSGACEFEAVRWLLGGWLECVMPSESVGFLVDTTMGAARAVRTKLEMSRKGWRCIVAVAMLRWVGAA